MINLVALRSLAASSGEDDDNVKLRRYTLGLALVALSADQDGFLREGCHLVPDKAKPAQWHLVKHDGDKCDPRSLDHNSVKRFAEAAADEFGVIPRPITATFDPALANAVLGISKADDRKKLLRQGPVTKDAIARFTGGSGTSWNKMKKDELEAECEKRSLPTDGNKQDLVKRLEDSDTADQRKASSEAEVES